LCGGSKRRKDRSFISRIPRLASLTKHHEHPTTSPVPYSQSQFAGTQTSLHTIRRFTPLTSPLQSHSVPPSILILDVEMKCDYINVDAQFNGECIVQTTVSAKYSHPPVHDGTTGFDGVILFDESLNGSKHSLGKNACNAIIATTSPNDRLGFITFGRDLPTIVSELIMCTSPYKQALLHSVDQLTTAEPTLSNANTFGKGLDMALKLLEKDARNGGHIFLISDGNPSFYHSLLPTCSTTLHTIAIGLLTCPTTLRNLRHGTATFLEFRNVSDDKNLELLVKSLASNIWSHSIETVRCRLIPQPHTSILDVINIPTTSEAHNEFALTLCIHPSPTFLTPPFLSYLFLERC